MRPFPPRACLFIRLVARWRCGGRCGPAAVGHRARTPACQRFRRYSTIALVGEGRLPNRHSPGALSARSRSFGNFFCGLLRGCLSRGHAIKSGWKRAAAGDRSFNFSCRVRNGCLASASSGYSDVGTPRFSRQKNPISAAGLVPRRVPAIAIAVEEVGDRRHSLPRSSRSLNVEAKLILRGWQRTIAADCPGFLSTSDFRAFELSRSAISHSMSIAVRQILCKSRGVPCFRQPTDRRVGKRNQTGRSPL